MLFLKRIGLFLLAFTYSGHPAGAWVWSGMVTAKMKREKQNVV